MKTQIKKFKGLENVELELEGITEVSAKNGVGKTSILDALCWFFTGKNIYGDTKFDIIKHGSDYASVSLEFAEFTLTKKIVKDGNSTKTLYYKGFDEIKSKDFDIIVNENFGYADTDIMLSTMVYEYYFTNLTMEKRRKIILDTFKINEDTTEIDTKKAELEAIKKKIDDIKVQINAYKNVKIVESTKNDAEIKKEIEKIKQLIKQKEFEISQLSALQTEIAKINYEIETNKSKIDTNNKMIAMYNDKLVTLRNNYKEVAKRRADICFNCKQTLPDNLQKIEFDKKAKELENLTLEGKKLATEIEQLQNDIKNLQDYIVINENKLKTLQLQLKNADVENIKRLKVELELQLEDLLKQSSNDKVTTNIPELLKIQTENLKQLSTQKLAIESELKQLQEARIQLAESFENEVNSNFDVIKFSFFEQLTNGDLKPACKILVNDVDYLSASDSEKIRANVELMLLLRKNYNLKYPLLVDRGESFDDNNYAKLIERLKEKNINVIITKVSEVNDLKIEKI
jgi:exonuclease SbcC